MTGRDGERFAAARAVADAVIYEGYLLYPYRASAAKNQVRWPFGVLSPRAYAERAGAERWALRTECLLEPAAGDTLTVRVRYLQVQHRGVEAVVAAKPGRFRAVDGLEVDGIRLVPWDEAVEGVVELVGPAPTAPCGVREVDFDVPGGTETEDLCDAAGVLRGRFVRRRRRLRGRLRVEVGPAEECRRLRKVTVTVANVGPWADVGGGRAEAVASSLVAVHTMLGLERGRFVSVLDPPPDAARAAAACCSEGTFPVLIGAGDVVLSSPIILYDYPQVAAESPGDLYDATEIDEILALRVLTLTDAEKAEARATDARAAAIIDRCSDLTPAGWERLHGTMASTSARPPAPNPEAEAEGTPPPGVPWWDPVADAEADPWSHSVSVGGVEVTRGTAVRLRPSHRADAQDLFLVGRSAMVAGVFLDVDGAEHVAVTVEGDPASDELAWQGRYLFFHPDEVEPLEGGTGRP